MDADIEIPIKRFGKKRMLKFKTRNDVTNVFIDKYWEGTVEE